MYSARCHRVPGADPDTGGHVKLQEVIADPVTCPASAPISVATRDRGVLEVFWRTAGGGLGHARSDRRGWGQPEVFDDCGPMRSPPSAAATADDVVDVFWSDAGGGLRHKRFAGGRWRPATAVRAEGLGS